MLRNNNGKFIRQLAKECIRANKIRNCIAVFAIMLTTVLFTSIAVVLEGASATITEQRIRQSETRFMMSVKYITEEASEKLLKNPEFSKTGKLQNLGLVQNEEVKHTQMRLAYGDESYLKNSFAEIETGSFPMKENEILADSVVLERLGIKKEVGQIVPLVYEVNGEIREKKMVVSGICEEKKKDSQAMIYLSKAGLMKELEGILPPEEGVAGAGSISIYVSFSSSKNLEEKRDSALREAGYDPDAKLGEAGYVVSNLNPAYGGWFSLAPGVILGASVMFFMTIGAGYLIISNIFRISVLKDIRMYGQLKTIGASPSQLQKLLVLQADRLNRIGIPLGLIMGYLLGRLLLPVIMKTTRFADIGMISVSIWMFGGAAAFSWITVRISCRRPAKVMSYISPVQALRYQGVQEDRNKQSNGRESKARIFWMAVSGFTQNKGKTLLVVLSLALSIILLNCVINFTGAFSRESFVKGQSAADFIVSHIEYDTGKENENYVVPKEFLDAVKNRTDLEKEGSVYCYQPPQEVMDEYKNTRHYNGITTVKIETVNSVPYAYQEEMGKMLYGFEENMFERCKVVSGTLDKEKLESGKYIVEATGFINDGVEYDEKSFTLKPGDKVKGEIGGVPLAYEVLANVVVNYGLINADSSGESAFFILPSQEYLNQFPGKLPLHFVMDVKEDAFEEVDAFLGDYEQMPQANIKYFSAKMVSDEFYELKSTFIVTGEVLAGILGFIGILNFFNVILTNAATRQREFAILQSIGMTRKQLRRLFVTESLLYAAAAGAVGLVLSAVLSVTAVRGLTQIFWFCKYRFTVLPACALIPVYLLAAVIISLEIDRIWNGGSVTERLRNTKQ